MLKASLKRYFLTGLLVMIPIWGTVLILKTLFLSLDGILGDAAARLVTRGYYIPGLGIVALVLLIFLTGLFAANFIGRHVVRQWENLLNRVPVVRGIYSTIKSMMDILSFAERETYRRVVLIQFPKNGHYCFAFVTGVTKGEIQTLARPARPCVCPDVAQSHFGIFSFGAGAGSDRGGYFGRRSHEADCVGRVVYTQRIRRVDAIGRKVVARRPAPAGCADRLVCTRRSLLSCRPL